PLHISYLHDGDPEHPQTHTVHHVKGKKKGTTEDVVSALGSGVHSAYEDDMVSAHRDDMLKGLEATHPVKASDLITSGSGAAKATIAMMRKVFQRIPPR